MSKLPLSSMSSKPSAHAAPEPLGSVSAPNKPPGAMHTRLLGRLTLSQLLTVPYVVLMLCLAALIAALAYRAGAQAVDTVSRHLIAEVIGRISQATDRNLSGSGAVLEAAFPGGMGAPADISGEVDALRTRFWIATALHRDLNNYVYYGNRAGQFMGLVRKEGDSAELRLKFVPGRTRSIYTFDGIGGALINPRDEDIMFEPRSRPWYVTGQNSRVETWTSIYVDFRTGELVATRAKRVPLAKTGAASGNPAISAALLADDISLDAPGVVATDVSLATLNQFVRQLTISRNGVAFIIEPDGKLVASSSPKVSIVKTVNGEKLRQNATDAEDPLIAAVYRRLRDYIETKRPNHTAQTFAFNTADGQAMQVGFATVRDNNGLNWITVVAIPSGDFLQGVAEHVRAIALLGVLAALAMVGIGLLVMRHVARDISQLSEAAKLVGDGHLEVSLNSARKDQIGDLARSFTQMQHRLRTDRLTGLVNREALHRRLELGISELAANPDLPPLALLFIDLNNFKQINDRFGHATGDKVLVEVGERLGRNIRGRDLVARYAGDEFVVLLPAVADEKAAEVVRRRFEHALAEPLACLVELGEDLAQQFASGAAVGMAMCPLEALNADDLIKAADADMYARKAAQRPYLQD